MVRDHPRHGRSTEISLRHLPDLSDDMIGSTSFPGSTFDDSFEIPTNLPNPALANMSFNLSEVDASFQIPTGGGNEDLLMDVDDDFFRTGARCELTLSQLTPSPKKGKSPRKTTMSPKKIAAQSPSPRKAPFSRSPTPPLRRSPRKHTSPTKLDKVDNVRMGSPTPKRKSKVERSPLPSPSRFDSLRMEVQMLAPIQLNQEQANEDVQDENKMFVDEAVSVDHESPFSSVGVATPKKQAVLIATDMMVIDDRVGSENKVPRTLTKPNTPKTPRHEPLRLSHLSPLKNKPQSSPPRATDDIQSSPEVPDSSSSHVSPQPSEFAEEISSEQLTPTPTAPPSPMKPATKRAATSPPESEDDGQKEPARKRDRKDIQQEKTKAPFTAAKKTLLTKKETSHSSVAKKTSQMRNKVVPVRAADRKKPVPSSSRPVSRAVAAPAPAIVHSQPKPPRTESTTKSFNAAKPQPPRKPDSRVGNEAQRPVHKRADSKPEVTRPVVRKEPTRAVSVQPKESSRPEKPPKPRSIPPQNRAIPAGNRPGSSTSSLSASTTFTESVVSMSEAPLSRAITPRPGSSQGSLDSQTEIKKETEHSLEPVADTVAPAPERLAFVKEEEIEDRLDMTVETTTTTKTHVRSQSRLQVSHAGHSNSASTSTSRHAPSVPLSVIKARMGLTPTVPHSPQFTTKKRLVSRHAFDEQLREKEREKEMEMEEERKRREVEEERELKEMRKALVIKAHEVPEWYKEVPRKGAKGE